MNIFEVIDKLELIKHKYLINKLEKYTQQVAAATTTPLAPPLAPPPAPPPATTPPTPPATTPTPPTPSTPPAKPVEEAKKPSEEAVKFENNMMDTLKWVFIGIAIFVVILIILGVVYWFMFGSSSSTTSSSENVVDENGNIVDGAEGANAEANAYANADANADAINNQQDPNDPYAYNEAPVSQDPYSDNLDNNASSTSMFSSLIPSSSSFSRNDAVSTEAPVVVPEVPEAPVVVPEAPEVPVVVPEAPEVPIVVPEVPIEAPVVAPQSLSLSSSSSSSPPIIGNPAPTNVVQK
jgi:hypothetical protein